MRAFPILATVRIGTVLGIDSAPAHLFLRFSRRTRSPASYYGTLDAGGHAGTRRESLYGRAYGISGELGGLKI